MEDQIARPLHNKENEEHGYIARKKITEQYIKNDPKDYIVSHPELQVLLQNMQNTQGTVDQEQTEQIEANKEEIQANKEAINDHITTVNIQMTEVDERVDALETGINGGTF